jgi:hypothetical protein
MELKSTVFAQIEYKDVQLMGGSLFFSITIFELINLTFLLPSTYE